MKNSGQFKPKYPIIAGESKEDRKKRIQRLCQKRWKERNRSRVKALNKKYRDRHKARLRNYHREKSRQYREANREKINQRARQHRIENPEETRKQRAESMRKWCKKNPELKKERDRSDYEKHRAKRIANSQRRFYQMQFRKLEATLAQLAKELNLKPNRKQPCKRRK